MCAPFFGTCSMCAWFFIAMEMFSTTSSDLGPVSVPDDILEAVSLVGLRVSWTSDTTELYRFYCLRFFTRTGRVVFERRSFLFNKLFEEGRKYLVFYRTFWCRFV